MRGSLLQISKSVNTNSKWLMTSLYEQPVMSLDYNRRAWIRKSLSQRGEGRRGAGSSRSAGICPPEVKQVEVTCHLMHADVSLPIFYTPASRSQFFPPPLHETARKTF